MSLEQLKTFFMWTTAIHFSILILWVFLIKFGNRWFRRQQHYWFPIPQDQFMPLHYAMYGGYKLFVIVFSAAPYLALTIMGY